MAEVTEVLSGLKCWLEWKLLILLRVSFVVTQTASELLVHGIFPADFVSCITSTCTLLHFYTQSHVLCIEMSLATQTQDGQCFHGYVSMIKFSARLLFHTTTHKVSKQLVYAEFSLLTLNTMSLFQQQYMLLGLLGKEKLIHVDF